jgi:hypothetical protein
MIFLLNHASHSHNTRCSKKEKNKKEICSLIDVLHDRIAGFGKSFLGMGDDARNMFLHDKNVAHCDKSMEYFPSAMYDNIRNNDASLFD